MLFFLLAAVKKRFIGQAHSWSVVFTIGLALFNLGLFGIVLLSGRQLSTVIRQNFEVQIYMQKDFDRSGVRQFLTTLEAQPYVAQIGSRKAISFVSKEEAGQKFMLETGENFAQFLGENPLRDAVTIKIADAYLNPVNLAAIRKKILAMPGVFEVVYIESLIGSIQENLARVSVIFVAVSLLLFSTVIWLIRNTVRLSVYAQRFLIRSMELVGARPWFIQKPYVWSMIRQGFGGGLLAIFMLMLGLHFVGSYFPPVKQVIVPEQVGILMLGLLLGGALLAGFCALLSVRRFLGRRLEDLHVY